MEPDFYLYNELRTACTQNRLEDVKSLVERGANPHAFGYIHFISSVASGHLKIVEYLYSIGANIRVNNDMALKHAIVNGHLEIVKYLLSLGADTENMGTGWILYIASTRFEIVKYLISKGVSIELVKDERCKRYLSFCERMEEKKRVLAQKKIYFWWIQICYDPNHHSGCGKRMLEKSWLEFDKLQKNKN